VFCITDMFIHSMGSILHPAQITLFTDAPRTQNRSWVLSCLCEAPWSAEMLF